MKRSWVGSWRPIALVALAFGGIRCGTTEAEQGPPREERVTPDAWVTAPFDLAAVMRRTHFAYRREGDGWSGGHDTYAAHATTEALRVRPFRHVGARVVAGAGAVFAAADVTRGDVGLATRGGTGAVADDGHLVIARGAVVEEVTNEARGAEQRWTFARRPPGAGDLTVRVAVTGQVFAAATPTGIHFRDAHTGLGVRYGHGTWVDAAGSRTPVEARWEGAAIVLTVPASAVDGAAYPATLDPLIGPEFGVDQAPPGPGQAAAPAIASDGHDFLLVWEAHGAIVGTFLGPDGRPLEPEGFVISTQVQNLWQQVDNGAPAVASNGDGFVVAWAATYDTGTTNVRRVRAARVRQGSGVIDPGVVDVGDARGLPRSIAAASNGRDYLVAYRDSSTVYGATMRASGAPGGTITLATGVAQDEPQVASDGSDYLVAVGSTGVRVSAEGAVIDPAGLRLPGGEAIAFNGEDYVVAWSERRGGGSDLYAARVSPGGVVRDPAGFAVSTAPNAQLAPRLTSRGRELIAAWVDARASDACGPCALDPSSCNPCDCNEECSPEYTTAALFGARLDRRGRVLDPEGIALTAPSATSGRPIVAAHDAGALVAWAAPSAQLDDGSRTVYGAWLTRGGVVRGLPEPVLTRAQDDQRQPAVAADGDGGFFVAWQDYANRAPTGAAPTFSWDIHGARVGAFGAFGPRRALVISDAAGDQVNPAVAFDGRRYLVVWQDGRGGGAWDVYGARVSRGGSVHDPAGIAISTAPGDQTDPVVAGELVAWTDARHSPTTDLYDPGFTTRIYGARVSAAGTVRDPAGLALSPPGERDEGPSIAVDGGGYQLAWTRATTWPPRVVVARLVATGLVLGTTIEPDGLVPDRSPSVACGGRDCFVAWSRGVGIRSFGPGGAEIYGVRLTGGVVPTAPIALLQPASRTQSIRPRVAATDDGYLVVWEEQSARPYASPSRYGVFGARVRDGAPPELLAIATTDGPEHAPALATNPGGAALVVYARSDFGPHATAPLQITARLLTDVGAP